MDNVSRPGLPENPTAADITRYTAQERFLEAYAAIGGVYKAGAKANVSPRTFENWINADTFAIQNRFHEAQRRYLEKMEAEADRRAIDGVDKPVWYLGKLVGQETRYSDNLLMFRMKKLDPSYRENYTIVLDDRDVKGILDAMREAGTPRVVDGVSKIVEEPSQLSPEEEQPL